MSDINIKVDQSIIRTNLTNMIVHPNEKAIVNLIAGILEENHQASTLFVEYLLGKSEIILPIVGTVGKFKISSIWISDKALLENSEYNLNGYVTCIVTEQLGLHDYNQLKVDFPTVDSNGKKITASTGLELKQFLIDDNDFGDPPF
jgi:hypothetical protein